MMQFEIALPVLYLKISSIEITRVPTAIRIPLGDRSLDPTVGISSVTAYTPTDEPVLIFLELAMTPG